MVNACEERNFHVRLYAFKNVHYYVEKEITSTTNNCFAGKFHPSVFSRTAYSWLLDS